MEMFLAPLPMMYAFRNLLVLQQYVLMLMTSKIEQIFNFYVTKNQGYRDHKQIKFFRNFITDIQSRLLDTIFA